MLRSQIVAALILFVLTQIPCVSQIKGNSNIPLVLHAGSGTAEFTIQNTNSTTALPVALSISTPIDSAGQVPLTRPKIEFVQLPGLGNLPESIAPQHSIRVLATISNFTGSSTATAKLLNGDAEIGTLKCVALDAPLNIAVDGDGAAGRALSYRFDAPATLTLKNNDAQIYDIRWRFDLNSRGEDHFTEVPANGEAQLDLEPAFSEFHLTDLVHPSEAIGYIVLRLSGPKDNPDDVYPVKKLPVKLNLMLLDPDKTKLASYLYAFLLLALGGGFSILGNSVLPGIFRKITLRSQLNDLAARTTSVSTRVDSYLRVLLRLERKKIDVLLKSVRAVSLMSPEVLDEAAASIQRLSTRLNCAERIDALRRRFEQISTSAPPSLTDGLDKTLQSAADQLHGFALTDVALNAACGLLDQAEATFAKLDDAEFLSKTIADRFVSLKERIAQFPNAYYGDLQNAMPGVFNVLTGQFDDPKNITEQMLFAVDHAIAAIHTALDYAIVRASLPSVASSNCTDPGLAGKTRLLPHECDLLALLGAFSWRALREAGILIQEMREDIYESDVIAQIAKEGQAEIIFDTQRARPFLPVFFTVAFKDPRFNGAAAIQRLACRWSFPEDLNEDGWKVCHYFSNNERYPLRPQRVVVSASVQGQKASEAEPVEIQVLKKEIEVQGMPKTHENARFKAEALRFAIAFGVALAGLWSGALTQLQKLDFAAASFAIVALGYGADSIKNLLSQAPKKTV